MARVYLGIGSNIDRENNIQKGLDAMSDFLTNMQLSPVYESEAIGFSGDAFYNCVLQADTHLSVESLAEALRAVEHQFGRPLNAIKFSSRTLDIDLLTYDRLAGSYAGTEIPRQEILTNAFVLFPFADLCPSYVHPVLQKPLADIRELSIFTEQKLEKIDFVFNTNFS